MGFGFTNEVDRAVTPTSCVHSDNVIGNPASLSDTRLKDNQQAVPLETLTSIFDAVETKEYDFRPPGTDIDGAPLPTERRVGFIADDVKAAISGEAWANVVGSKSVHDTEYLTLDYSRLVVLIWGVVKELRARVKELEMRGS